MRIALRYVRVRDHHQMPWVSVIRRAMHQALDVRHSQSSGSRGSRAGLYARAREFVSTPCVSLARQRRRTQARTLERALDDVRVHLLQVLELLEVDLARVVGVELLDRLLDQRRRQAELLEMLHTRTQVGSER